MDKRHISPNNPPMPLTTKKATKRRKRLTKLNKPHSIRQPNQIGLIYQDLTDNTLARVATEEEERRLSSTGPSTSPRFGGMQILW